MKYSSSIYHMSENSTPSDGFLSDFFSPWEFKSEIGAVDTPNEALAKGISEFKCSACYKKFAYIKGLKRHYESAHMGLRFICALCGKDFVDKVVLRKHIRIVHLGIKIPKNVNGIKKTFACAQCDKIYTEEKNLKRHYQTVHLGVRHFCDLCGDSFVNKVNLVSHMESIHLEIKFRRTEGKSRRLKRIQKWFDCAKCEKKFKEREYLKKHVREVHEVPYYCDSCAQGFLNEVDYKIHLESPLHPGGEFRNGGKKLKYQKKRHECSKCEKKFNKQATLDKHYQSEHSKKAETGMKKLREWSECDETYTEGKILNLDNEVVHMGIQYYRDICEESFSKIDLKVHKESLHLGMEIDDDVGKSYSKIGLQEWRECWRCEEKFEDVKRLNTHFRAVHNRHSCKLCEIDFSQKRELKAHAHSVHFGIKYTCELCEKDFAKKYQLLEHKRLVHLGIKFSCDICGNQFSYMKNLRRHIKFTHSRPTKRPFKCNLCEKVFIKKQPLEDHMESTHLKLQYGCDSCGNIFSTNNKLKSHIHSTHSLNLYKCVICEKIFNKEEKLNAHVNSIHLNIQYGCDSCGKIFINKGDLNTHKDLIHPGVQSELLRNHSVGEPSIPPGIQSNLPQNLSIRGDFIHPGIRSESSQNYSVRKDLIHPEKRFELSQNHSYREPSIPPTGKQSKLPKNLSIRGDLIPPGIQSNLPKNSSICVDLIHPGIRTKSSQNYSVRKDLIHPGKRSELSQNHPIAASILPGIQSKLPKNLSIRGNLIHLEMQSKLHKNSSIRGESVHPGIQFKLPPNLSICGDLIHPGIQSKLSLNHSYKKVLGDKSASLISNVSSISNKTESLGNGIVIKTKHTKMNKIANEKNENASVTSKTEIIPKKIACVECKKGFTHSKFLNRHYRLEHPGVQFTRMSCGEIFIDPAKLNDRERFARSENQKMFDCAKCDKKYAADSNLIRHYQTAHSSAQFHCDSCGENIDTKDKLKLHRDSTHTKIATYKCDLCGLLFSEEEKYKIHVEIAHLQMKYPCDICGKIYVNKVDWNNHKRSIHPENESNELSQKRINNHLSNSEKPGGPTIFSKNEIWNVGGGNSFTTNQLDKNESGNLLNNDFREFLRTSNTVNSSLILDPSSFLEVVIHDSANSN